MKPVYILIVNWNGWKDTIECLESVFRNGYPAYRVLVCDNGSTDGSIDRIRGWAQGDLDLDLPESNPLRRLSHPPLPKPIPCVEYDRSHAEEGGNPGEREAHLVLIRTGANLGFAGGNNVGLRYALARGDFDYVWLLNNDTVIEPDALERLVERMGETPGAGMCGSTLPFYDRPGTIWTRCGGMYNPWTLHATGVDHGLPLTIDVDPRDAERRMDYVVGASMLVSRPFLQAIGLMSEEYFLYFEELDWAVRARGRYGMACAPRSVVYHKVGASTAVIGADCPGERKLRKVAHRATILFLRKYSPWSLPTALLSLLVREIVWRGRNLFRSLR